MNRFALALASLPLAACSTPNGAGTCLGSSCVAVATATYDSNFNGTGALNTVDINAHTSVLNVDATLDPDTTMKVIGSELWILQRDTGSLRIYDPSTFKVKLELPVSATGDTMHPAGSAFPQDFYVADDTHIYVTLSGNDAAHALGVLDRTAPGTIKYIGLPQSSADTDGKPEPFQIKACNDKLYILMQNYTIDSTSFTVTYQTGSVAIYDTTTSTVSGDIALTGRNPYNFAEADGCTDVYISESSNLTTVPDNTALVERVDLDAASLKGTIATDVQLGGRPYLIASVSDTLLYVSVYFNPKMNTSGQTLLSQAKVLAVDPTTKGVIGDVSGSYGNINFLSVYDDKLMYGAGIFAGMETSGNDPRGLYIGNADGTKVTAAPIDLKLTPSSIALP